MSAEARVLSLLILLVTKGQQFTSAELKAILERVGFAGIETTPTSAYYSVTTGYRL